VQRWQRTQAAQGDRRESGLRRPVCPPNKVSEAQRQVVMATLNSDAFKDLPPSQIVPRLADSGVYLVSESTMCRLLQHDGQHTHRRLDASRAAAQQATRPGRYRTRSGVLLGYHLPAHAGARRAFLSVPVRGLGHRIPAGQLTVHSDNPAPMKGETMLAAMQRLGVAHMRSRPAVSNDNP